MQNHHPTDTIAAIATASGIAAIGLIRVSGNQAIPVVQTLFPSRNLLEAPSHSLLYGLLKDDEELLDEVLISIFRAPASYTGEDAIEISCHGAPYILQKVMEALMKRGIRLANPGEFTMRAYLNGKMDLTRAEAVGDLINAESKAAHDTALRQMRGGFSKKLSELRQQLLEVVSLIELELDFAEEDVEFANRETLQMLLQTIQAEVVHLSDSFQLGNAIKKGVNVVIAGRPNAGKSTLLNNLLQEEKAIVSDIAGTTRDVIEDTISIEGILFRFIDTAGIRSTVDVLETLGIERTYSKLQESELIIYLFDTTEITAEMLEEDVNSLPEGKKILIVGNKADKKNLEELKATFPAADVFISALKDQDLTVLKNQLIAQLKIEEWRGNEVVVTNLRHYQELKAIENAITSTFTAIENGLPTDLVAVDLRMALHHLGAITGNISSDEILGFIFGKFCIGK